MIQYTLITIKCDNIFIKLITVRTTQHDLRRYLCRVHITGLYTGLTQ